MWYNADEMGKGQRRVRQYESAAQRSAGFTLVEILVVIALIVILTAIMFPVARVAVEKADRSSCVSNLHSIGVAVVSYMQDHAGYPPPPGYMGNHGIPTGGIPGLALENSALSLPAFWCKKDEFPDRFPNMPEAPPKRDLTGSSYAYGYNYYGYVTTTENLPFPVTTEEAAYKLFCEKIKDKDGTEFDNFDNIIDRKPVGTRFSYRPKGLFQGLWNANAPRETIITYCSFHGQGTKKVIPAVMLSGEATTFEAPSLGYANGGYKQRRATSRQPNPIDWRVNKIAFANNTKTSPNNALLGDAPGNDAAKLMPIAKVHYRQFLARSLVPDAEGYGWYDTGIPVTADDVVMFIANGRVNYAGQNDSRFISGPDSGKYQVLAGDSGLFFTSAGDPINKANITKSRGLASTIMLLPTVSQWAANTTYDIGAYVSPATPNGHYYKCTPAAAAVPPYTTGATPPAWPTSGATPNDGNIIWVESPPPTLTVAPHCLLVGSVGGMIGDETDQDIRRQYCFPIGSRGSYTVPAAIVPPGQTKTIWFSLNDTRGNYADDAGWCEVWIAIYRPGWSAK